MTMGVGGIGSMQAHAAILEAAGLVPIPAVNSASILAQRFEADISQRGWCTGAVFGPEGQLAEQYDASPYLVRQALRVLEGRELGKMRRGCTGGLVLQAPTDRITARMMAIYLTPQGLNSDRIAQAKEHAELYLQHASARAKSLLRGLIAELEIAHAEDAGSVSTTPAPNRALAIARRIVKDSEGDQAGGGDHAYLGTIDTLCDRYHSGRPVIMQALRVLGDLELVSSMRGRGGGLHLRLPTPAMIARITHAHLAARKVDAQCAREVIWIINRANASLAACSPDRDLAFLAAVEARVSSAAFLAGDLSAQIALLRYLGDLSGDLVLHMIVRCLFSYMLRTGMMGAEVLNPILAGRLSEATRSTAQAVRLGQPEEAVAAVNACEAVSVLLGASRQAAA